ncbi:hypothetical protein PIROE2DRAFT_11607 [Piromyces sp. E2]|nr:hypothetical protein PIROE2DRAFT_11607 [Piromyces sp. E2]|eukprot:OUM62196.1 hypothetical protein PIROE2DRAFT_11607 [Piromyces sp. E2]
MINSLNIPASVTRLSRHIHDTVSKTIAFIIGGAKQKNKIFRDKEIKDKKVLGDTNGGKNKETSNNITKNSNLDNNVDKPKGKLNKSPEVVNSSNHRENPMINQPINTEDTTTIQEESNLSTNKTKDYYDDRSSHKRKYYENNKKEFKYKNHNKHKKQKYNDVLSANYTPNKTNSMTCTFILKINDKKLKMNTLIDSGSSKSFICQSYVKSNNIPFSGLPSSLNIQLPNGKSMNIKHVTKLLKLSFMDHNRIFEFSIEFLSIYREIKIIIHFKIVTAFMITEDTFTYDSLLPKEDNNQEIYAFEKKEAGKLPPHRDYDIYRKPSPSQEAYFKNTYKKLN